MKPANGQYFTEQELEYIMDNNKANGVHEMWSVDAVDTTVRCEAAPMELRIWALDLLDAILGLGNDPATAENVIEYKEVTEGGDFCE